MELLSNQGPRKPPGEEGVRLAASLGGQRRISHAMAQHQPAAGD